MSTIAQNLEHIRAGIHEAALAACRDPDSVRLVAVSKTFPAADIQEAMTAGQRLFGENRAQELRDKADLLGAGPTWHFIGTLQRNKVKYVVGRVAMMESVDSLEIATELSARVIATGGGGGPNPLPVLLQVHLGDEASKHGVSPGDVLALAEQIVKLPGVALCGLMSVPPWCDEPEDSAVYFTQLARLAAEGRARGLPLTELSMGMSHDYAVAIRCGATLVRVGTAIFGER